MATTTVAAAGTALALYYYAQRRSVCGGDLETHTTAHSAPRSFLEDLYFFAEGMRYTYGETFGRWRTVDLLIGLSYLARRGGGEHPVADIARAGRPYAVDPRPGPARESALAFLARIERFFRYCSGLRERRPIFQRRYLMEVLDIPDSDILVQELRAGVLKPSYILTKDDQLGAIVLAVRGTHSFKDAFTSLTGASKPHHVVDANGVVLGYSHFGMLAAARWLKGQVESKLVDAMAANPGYKLYLVGHSLGGGTAAMLTMMLRESGGVFADVTCTAIACPACMTLELAKSCAEYVTTVVHATDVIPTISPGSADALRDEVAASSWGRDFRADLRSNSIVRAVETGLRGVGSATSWTATRLSACYQRRGTAAARPKGMGAGSGLEPHGPAATTAGHKRRTSDLAEAMGGAEGPGAARLRRAVSVEPSSVVVAAAEDASGKGKPRPGGVNDAAAVASTAGGSLTALLRTIKTTATTRAAAFGGFRATTTESGPSSALNTTGTAATAATATHGGASPPPSSMEIDFASEYVSELDMELADDTDVDEEGVAALGIDQPRSALQAEAEVRLAEVARAVSAAESEEAEAAAAAGGKNPSTVPSVIRPGGYGGGDRGAARGASGTAWRRMMYPAGRIMHLVPARLVPGLEEWAQGGEDGVPGTPPPFGAVLSSGDDGAWPEALMEEGEDYPIPRSPWMSSKSMGGAVAASLAVVEETVAPLPPPPPPSAPAHSRQISELSLKDMVTAEEAAGSAAAGGGGHHGPLPPLKPPIGPPPEQMVLLDAVPQEAYGRIKLCRTALSDHVIPNYLRSLASYVERL